MYQDVSRNSGMWQLTEGKTSDFMRKKIRTGNIAKGHKCKPKYMTFVHTAMLLKIRKKPKEIINSIRLLARSNGLSVE